MNRLKMVSILALLALVTITLSGGANVQVASAEGGDPPRGADGRWLDQDIASEDLLVPLEVIQAQSQVPGLVDETLLIPPSTESPDSTKFPEFNSSVSPFTGVSSGVATDSPYGTMSTEYVLDDFNRVDGPIGPGWTVHNGNCNVVGNAAACSDYGRTTYNGAPGDGDTAEADIAVVGNTLQYTGLLLNYGAGIDNLFLKIQQQSPYMGKFNYGGCYTGNNDTGFGLGFFELSSPFSTAHMKAIRVGTTVTITLSNIDGGTQPNQVYVCEGAPVPEGEGIGILGYDGTARLDNFGIGGGCDDVLWDNGPLITHPGGGYNGFDASVLQTALSMNTYGFGAQYSVGNRMADEFTITGHKGWKIEQLTFFSYQTGTYTDPPASTFTGLYYQIWDGPPDNPASSVIYGNLTTNRLISTAWTDSYRVVDYAMTNNTRPIMTTIASADVYLPPGTYWLDWMFDGTGSSGPWAPPITILGQTTTGNALQYTASSAAWGPANDSGTLTQQGIPFVVTGCVEEKQWREIPENPIALMDNVLAAYDGKIWSITGYATPGVSYYTPATETWTTVPSSTPPFGYTFARSGCQVGNKVYIYGDSSTSGFTGLWSYNMATNTWMAETPGGTPPPHTAIWAPAWVWDSVTNRCYMTGGATAPGNGNLATTYVYNPATNQWLSPLPAFDTVRDFHAAFIFTRPSDSYRLLCVIGGVHSSGESLNSTQCYNLTTEVWNDENADLGILPIGWWGMGYTERQTDLDEQLWLINGIDPSWNLHNQTWYYSAARNAWVNTGRLDSGTFYRTSAVTLNGTVYHIGGSTGGFSPSGLSDKFVGKQVYLPAIIK